MDGRADAGRGSRAYAWAPTRAGGRGLAGRYDLDDYLGRGEVAAVYRAFDRQLGRDVALRLYRLPRAPDAAGLARFGRHLEAVAALDHPCLAAVFDYGVADVGGDAAPGAGLVRGRSGSAPGSPYVATEFVPGGTLEAALRRRGPLPAAEALRLGAQVAAALQAVHANGLVHGALSARNVLLDDRGAVRVTDTGLAGVFEARRRAPADARGDLDALGRLLHALLLGGPPPAQAPGGTDSRRVEVGRPVPGSGAAGRRLAPPVEALLATALAPDPATCYGSAAEMHAALTRALEGQSPSAVTRAVPSAAPALGSGAAGPRPNVLRPRPERVVAPATAVRPRQDPPAVPVAPLGVTPTAAVASPAPPAAPPEDVAVAPPAVVAAAPPSAGLGGRRTGPLSHRPLEGAAPPRPPGGAGTQARPAPPHRHVLDERARGRAYVRLVAIAGLAWASLLATLVVATRPAWAPGERRAAPPPPAASALAAAQPAAGPPAAEPTLTPVPLPPQSAALAPAPAGAVTPPPAQSPLPRPPDAAPAPAPTATGAPAVPGGGAAPAQAVLSFYDLAGTGRFEDAARLWSPRMQAAYPPGENIFGRFGQTRRLTVAQAQTVALDPAAGRATVAVEVVEEMGVPPISRRFVGTWQLVRTGGSWLLDQPNLRPG